MICEKNQISNAAYANSIICSTCHRPILNEIYCHCLKCKSYNQCIHCLQSELKTKEHIPNHYYVLLDRNDPGKYDEDWNLFEEINIIYSMQLHGFENWREVSQCVGTKTALECKEHYENIYLLHDNAPGPKHKSSKCTTHSIYPLFDELSNPVISFENNNIIQEAKTYSQFSGYMPNRDEYETEPDNEAEAMLSGISFATDLETEETIQEKIKLIESYTKIVKKRQLQHDFIKSTDFLDQPIGVKSNAYKSKYIHKNIYPLLRFINKETAETISRIIQNEKLTYQDIKEKISWLANGIKSRNEGKIFSQILEFIDENDPTKIEMWNLKFEKEIENTEFKNEIYNSLISAKEKLFCNKENISPQNYVSIKEYVTIQSLEKNQISLSQILFNKFKDWNLVCKVFAFLVDSGYIPNELHFMCDDEESDSEKNEEKQTPRDEVILDISMTSDSTYEDSQIEAHDENS